MTESALFFIAAGIWNWTGFKKSSLLDLIISTIFLMIGGFLFGHALGN